MPAGVSDEASLEGDRLWLKAGETIDALIESVPATYDKAKVLYPF